MEKRKIAMSQLLYEYTSVQLSKENHIEEINEWATKGYKLVSIVKENTWGRDVIITAYFEKVK